SLFQLNRLIDNALSDDGLGDTRDRYSTLLRRDLDLHLQADLIVIVNRRRHIDVHADIDVGELRLHADAGNAGRDSGVVRTRGDRNSLPHLELSPLTIGSPNAWVLQDVRV